MKELDSIDRALLFELIGNSRKSDRDLARTLHISQPTVTRRRARVEKEFIDAYTAIPKWERIGFEIVAFTLFKMRMKYSKPEEREMARKKAQEWSSKQANIVLALGGQGIGHDGLCVSFHKSYSDYAQFKRKVDSELSDLIMESESFIADLNPGVIIKPLNFKYLEKV